MTTCCHIPQNPTNATQDGETIPPVLPPPAGGWSQAAAYAPLWWTVGVSFLAGWALSVAGVSWMLGWMGVFVLILAFLKLQDIPAFAQAFQSYDLVARRFPKWGYCYPFLELGLGLWLLSGWMVLGSALATIIIFGSGAVSVWLGLRRGVSMPCPCLGTTLKAPLSRVTVVENLVMVGMGAALLM